MTEVIHNKEHLNGKGQPCLWRRARWLEIDDEMKVRDEYYYGWYCIKCNAILGRDNLDILTQKAEPGVAE